jgi:parallel beta-helix repeat protein
MAIGFGKGGMVKAITSEGKKVTFRNCKFLNSGVDYMPGLQIEGDGEADIQNCEFFGNLGNGLDSWIIGRIDITNSKFENNGNHAIYVRSETGLIAGNTVTSNEHGIATENGKVRIENNTITDNSHAPLNQYGNAMPIYGSNIMSGNGIEAIRIGGTLSGDPGNTYVLENPYDYPYYSQGFYFTGDDGRIIIPAGAIFQLDERNGFVADKEVSDKIEFQGTVEDPIIFTSPSVMSLLKCRI